MLHSPHALHRFYYRCLVRFGLLLSITGLIPTGVAAYLVSRSAGQTWVMIAIGSSVFLISLSTYAIVQWRILFRHIRPAIEMGRLGTTMARVAHDLRGPLASLRAASISLTKPTMPSSDLRRLLQLAIGRIERVSDDILDDHDTMRSPHSPIDVQSILLALIQEYQLHPALRDVTFSTAFTTETVLIQGQRHRLERMLANVLKNAVEAINFSGQITVHTSDDHHTATIGIRDTGRGLHAEQIVAILSQQRDAAQKHLGHGIGLAFVQDVLHEHGGSLQIESSPGCGAVFLLSLPLTRATVASKTTIVPLRRTGNDT